MRTDSLDMLPEPVRDAVAWLMNDADGSRPAADHVRTIRDYCTRLARANRIHEIKNAGTLANNLCPDHRDKQTGKPCLACTIETLTRQKEKAESDVAAHLQAFKELSERYRALEARVKRARRADGQRVFDLLCLPVEFDGTLALVKLEDGE